MEPNNPNFLNTMSLSLEIENPARSNDLRSDKADSSEGIDPVNSFDKWRYTRFVRFPKEVGRVPVISFCARLKILSEVRPPTSRFILPMNLLSSKFR
jgi:hypothetical protein